MLTIVLAGLFWLGTGWPHGDMMLLVLAPIARCWQPRPTLSPARALSVAPGRCRRPPSAPSAVLPLIDGFPCWSWYWPRSGCRASMPPVRRPRRWLAYLVAFNTDGGQQSHAHGLPAFLNYAAAWVLATIFALLAFRLILPRDPARELARLRATVRRGAGAAARWPRAAEAWQQRQQHRWPSWARCQAAGPPVRGAGAEPCRDAPGPRGAAHPARAAPPRTARRRQHVAMQGLERLARQPGPPLARGGPRETARLLERMPTASPLRARRCRRSWPRSPTSMRWRAGMPRTSTPNHHGSPRHVERVRRGRHLRAAAFVYVVAAAPCSGARARTRTAACPACGIRRCSRSPCRRHWRRRCYV